LLSLQIANKVEQLVE